jgi:adenylate kinase
VRVLIIVCTGISGSGRREAIVNMVGLARKKGFDIQIKNVGQMMYEKAEEGGYPISEGKILDLPAFTLRSLRWSVFEDILRTIDDAEHTIIDTHACFRWKKFVFDGFDYSYLSKLKPDIYFNVMDTIYSIKGRLELQKGWQGKHSLLELLIWRDEEAVLTRTFAEIQNKEFYHLFYDDPPESMFQIAFQSEVKKAYLSYPISFATPEQIQGVEVFRDALRKKIVIFDPLGNRDMSWLTAAAALKKQGETEIVIPFRYGDVERTVIVPLEEIFEANDYLMDQTVNIDFMLIDQSDFIVVNYYDPDIHSPGVNNEMQYARSNGKDVYIYWPESRMSPFLERNITKHFKTQEELLDFFS